jgi:hypothetical protein
MPRYSAVAPAALPRTESSAVRTTGTRPDPWPGEAVEPAAEQAASVATARQATAAIQIHVLKPKVSLLSSAPLVLHRER